MSAKTSRRIEYIIMAAVCGAAIAVCVAPFVDAEIPSRAVSADVFVRHEPEREPVLVAPECEPVVAQAANDPKPTCEGPAKSGARDLRDPAAEYYCRCLRGDVGS